MQGRQKEAASRPWRNSSMRWDGKMKVQYRRARQSDLQECVGSQSMILFWKLCGWIKRKLNDLLNAQTNITLARESQYNAWLALHSLRSCAASRLLYFCGLSFNNINKWLPMRWRIQHPALIVEENYFPSFVQIWIWLQFWRRLASVELFCILTCVLSSFWGSGGLFDRDINEKCSAFMHTSVSVQSFLYDLEIIKKNRRLCWSKICFAKVEGV